MSKNKNIIKMSTTRKNAAEPSLENYNNGFYNSFVTACQLSPSNFQLTQGAFAQPLEEKNLYAVFDGVPPKSVSNLFTPNSINALSDNYVALFDYATPAEQNSFIYKIAMQNFISPKNWIGGEPGVNPMYSPDKKSIENALANGSAISFAYDSKTANSDISNSWAKSDSSGGVFFWGTSSSHFEQTLNSKAESAQVTVEMSMTFTTVPIQPGGWLYKAFLIKMYQNPSLWSGGQNQWDTLFGPAGSLQFLSTQALIATGIKIRTTSKTSYTTEEFNYVHDKKDINVWPFYTSTDESSTFVQKIHNADGSISTTTESKPGAVQILGFTVSSVQSLIQSNPTLLQFVV